MTSKSINTFAKFKKVMREHERDCRFSDEALQMLYDYFDVVDEGNIDMDSIDFANDFTEQDEGSVRTHYHLTANQDVGEFLRLRTIVLGETNGKFVFIWY
jgi:hypothetical protein